MARTKPIDHSTGSAIATTAWTAGKYGIGGAIVAGLVGAAVFGGIAALGVAAAGAVAGLLGVGGAAAAVTSTIGMAAIGIASFLGFGGALTTTGGIAAITAGGLMGLFKGGRRVTHERQAYQDRVENRAPAHHGRLENAAEASMQQGYMQGLQDGQQMVVNKIRELQYAALQQQMDKDKTACAAKGPHVQAEMKRRETAAAAGQQIG